MKYCCQSTNFLQSYMRSQSEDEYCQDQNVTTLPCEDVS